MTLLIVNPDSTPNYEAPFLPGVIHVATEFPTQRAALGLHYYAAVDKGTIVPIRRILSQMYAEKEDTQFGGMASTYTVLGDLKVYPLTSAQRERLFDLGYNPIYFHVAQGAVIWGNHIEGAGYSLPELVEIVRTFHQIYYFVFDLILPRQMEFPFGPTMAMCTLKSMLDGALKERQRRRMVVHSPFTRINEHNVLTVQFQTRDFGFVTELQIAEGSLHVWAIPEHTNLLKPALLALYPQYFVPHPDIEDAVLFCNSVILK